MAIIDEIIMNEAAGFNIDPIRKKTFDVCFNAVTKAIKKDGRIYVKVINDLSKYKSFLNGSSNTLALKIKATNKTSFKKFGPSVNIGFSVGVYLITVKEGIKRIEKNMDDIVDDIMRSVKDLKLKSISTKLCGVIYIKFKDN